MRDNNEEPTPDDREIARQSYELEQRARDFRLVDLPEYLDWSRQKLAAGEAAAHIAHLDATACWLLPEEAAKMNASDYNDLLEDLKYETEE